MTAEELSERMLNCSVRVGRVVDALPETRLGRHVAGQLVRCGTASGPNYEEGCAAESPRDFIHKLRIALKEMRETNYWLRFSAGAELLSTERLSELISETEELKRILGKSIVTARSNLEGGVEK
jgi:four helix bundle protein